MVSLYQEIGVREMPKRYVYMDNNATTPLHPEVKKAITKAMDIFGNASSFHSFGRKARDIIEEARDNIASFIGSDASEILFVGSGSEANNTVFNMLACPSGDHGTCRFACTGKRQVITSQIEHPCIIESSKCIRDKGVPVVHLGVDKYGKINIEELKEKISDKTGLVSVMLANNEIGTIQDVKEIAEIAHKHGALTHTDAIQAIGKVPVNVRDLNVDLFSISAHKIYGPKGIGALYVKEGTPFCTFIRGGHQEKGRRAGTENTLGIIGLSKAIDMLRKEMDANTKRFSMLKQRLRDGIKKDISDIRFNGHPEDCLPNTLNVSFEGSEGEAILLYLDQEGIAVSTGSACASGSLDPSHVLLATGLGAEFAHGSIRFSLGRENTEQDVDYVLQKLPIVIEKIRKMSSAY